jgi:DNA-binding response OmpR family regulator
MKILIVDDEAHIRQMMRLTLEASGYEVVEAVNGEQGLIRFGDGSGIDAVVLDQRMPGIDGLQTLREIRVRAPGAAVLMVTAFASVELAVEAMKVGAADFLRKPMTPDALRAALGAALAGAHSATGERIVPRPEQKPRIEMVTLNGFRIRRASRARELLNPEHVFHVNRFPDDTGTTVTVSIAPEAVARVERLTKRMLPPGGAFWHEQAERLLAAVLWSEGRVPDDGRLTVSDVSRDDLDLAASWTAD